MAFKSVLVHIDDSDLVNHRLQVAEILQRRFGAHIEGLCLASDPVWPGYIEGAIPAEALQNLSTQRDQRVAAARQRFDDFFKEGNATAHFTVRRVLETTIDDEIATATCYHQMAIFGQPNATTESDSDMVNLDQLVTHCAAPILIVPYIGLRAEFARSIMVAWNGRRESARALFDAMPMLCEAEKVHIFRLTSSGDSDNDLEYDRQQMQKLMDANQVNAEIHFSQADNSPASDLLLSRAADLGADLMVMGAYGHSRLREMVLGGATREILRHMTIPILMSR